MHIIKFCCALRIQTATKIQHYHGRNLYLPTTGLIVIGVVKDFLVLPRKKKGKNEIKCTFMES